MNAHMDVSERGLRLIAEFEGFRATPYNHGALARREYNT